MASVIPFIVFGVIFLGSLFFFMYVNRESATEEPAEKPEVPEEVEQ